MEIHVWQLLIICPLVFIGGFIDAIAGGGGLITLPAYMIAGIPVHNAVATNKLSSTMGTSISTYRYAKSGYINYKQAIFCVAAAMSGSTVGARIALLLSDSIFEIVMLIILPLTGLYVLTSKTLQSEKEPLSEIHTIILSTIVAFCIGMYDGFYGPGTGTFLILLLVSVVHMSLKDANGMTKAINMSSNVAALVVYLINGKTLVPIGLIAGVFGILGNYFGARCFERGAKKIVKPTMIIVLTIFFSKIIIERFV